MDLEDWQISFSRTEARAWILVSEELSDQEAISLYNALKRTYGELLPNFHYNPLQFEHFVKLYRFQQVLDKYKKWLYFCHLL